MNLLVLLIVFKEVNVPTYFCAMLLYLISISCVSLKRLLPFLTRVVNNISILLLATTFFYLNLVVHEFLLLLTQRVFSTSKTGILYALLPDECFLCTISPWHAYVYFTLDGNECYQGNGFR